MPYITVELHFKSWEGPALLFLILKSYFYKCKSPFTPKVKLTLIRLTCLYSRGQSSNKSHKEYDAGEENETLISDNKNETQLFDFC